VQPGDATAGLEVTTIGFGIVLEDFFRRRGMWQDRQAWTARALRAARTSQRRGEEGGLLNNLGLMTTGDLARVYFEDALQIHREVGNRSYEANTLNNLGRFYAANSNTKRAEECHHDALVIRRDVGDRLGEAISLNCLGGFYLTNRDLNRATECIEEARRIHSDLGNLEGEADSLVLLGII
jgi:tetratricopeptide (TPR) repeat protein